MNTPPTTFINWKVEYCCNCGVPFAMTTETYKNYSDTGKVFFCPNGHQQHYTESCSVKLGKLNSQITNLNQRLETKDQTIQYYKNSRRTYKGKVTHLKKLVAQ